MLLIARPTNNSWKGKATTFDFSFGTLN